MRFVTAQDFSQTDFNIPNLDNVINSFDPFVIKREKKILVKLLGRQLYNAFVSGLDALPAEWSSTANYTLGQQVVYGNDIWEALQNNTDIVPIEGDDWTLEESGNRWLNLKNGADYIYDARTYQWEGMKEMLVPYVFSEWIGADYPSNTGIGFVTPNSENSTTHSPASRIVIAWREFLQMVGDHCDVYDTLYGFLYTSGTVYADVYESEYSDFQSYLFDKFEYPGSKNLFDI